MSKFSDRLKARFAALYDTVTEGLTTPDNVKRYDDISYGESPEQMLDVYRPSDAEGPLPVIVNVHGGGWVYGNKEHYQYYCMRLAGYGFAVVNFSYRLAPDSKFPASLEDTDLVMRWVHKNAENYGLDLNKLFMLGDSAGAHLLGLYTNARTNPKYASRLNFALSDNIQVRAVGLTCGVYKADSPLLIAAISNLLNITHSLKDLNVVDFVTKDFPPVFLMTSAADYLKSQAPKLQKRLLEVNVPFEYHFYSDKKAKLVHCYFLSMQSPFSKIMIDDLIHFFEKHM